jgi:tetratricopeptide (TPR) repeat protein
LVEPVDFFAAEARVLVEPVDFFAAEARVVVEPVDFFAALFVALFADDFAAGFAALFAAHARTDVALEILEAARRRAPDSFAVLYNLGAVHLQANELERAEQFYVRALAAKPEDAATLRALARVWRVRGDLEKSFAYSERALRVEPDSHAALYDYGWTALNLDRLPEAIGALERLHVLRPDEPEYVYTLAVARFHNHEDAEALALLRAVGGFQAYRRAVPLPATALPVMRFLLYDATYPVSVAASTLALLGALTAADPVARDAAPVLRLRRLIADLEFRSRAGDGDRAVGATLATVQLELTRVDADIADRYFGRTAAPPIHVV